MLPEKTGESENSKLGELFSGGELLKNVEKLLPRGAF